MLVMFGAPNLQRDTFPNSAFLLVLQMLYKSNFFIPNKLNSTELQLNLNRRYLHVPSFHCISCMETVLAELQLILARS